MKDRLWTLVLAIGALVAFYILFGPRPEPEAERVTRPTSAESGPNGYAVLVQWLQGQGVKTAALRERYGRLAEIPEVPQESGNLLLSTAPHFYPMRESELKPLQEWIAKGNTLLLAAGMSDTPDWSATEGDPLFMQNMSLITGLQFEMIRNENGDEIERETAPESVLESVAPPRRLPRDYEAEAEAEAEDSDEEAGETKAASEDADRDDSESGEFERLPKPRRYELSPMGLHPLLHGVSAVTTLSDYPTVKWAASAWSPFLELAKEKELDAPGLWLRPYGEGQIILVAYGAVFTNKVIGESDNARFLANVIGASVRGEGRVILDDAHQGRVAFYDPDAFFGDKRLYRTLWWLLVLWLVFVLGSQRLQSAGSRWAPLDIASFVRATGGFMARVLKPAAAGQRLIQNFFDDVRRRAGLPDGDEPVWDWLRVHAEGDAAELRKLDQAARAGRRIDLSRLHNLLVKLRASLA